MAARRSAGRLVLLALGLVWAAPNSLLGLIAGTLAIPFGARPKLRPGELALVFHGYPIGPGGALTLGNVMLTKYPDLDILCTTYAHRAKWCVHRKTRIGDHERAHVLQYMAFGPLFLPLYLLCGGVSVRNRFERAADRYALTGSGWWPWLKANSREGIVMLGTPLPTEDGVRTA
jgi:hypothetical protein